MSLKRGYRTLKSMLLTYSVTRLGIFDSGSRTTSSKATIFGPPARFCKILISRLIFFFFTGFSTLIIHFSSLAMLIPSKTWARFETADDVRQKMNRPRCTFHVPPSVRSHSGLETPIALAGCLEGIRGCTCWNEQIAPSSPYSCHDGPSFAFTSA